MAGPIRRCGELRKLISWAKELGFAYSYTGGNHVKFTRPNTRDIYTAASPGDHRAYMNARANLKRAVREAETLSQTQ